MVDDPMSINALDVVLPALPKLAIRQNVSRVLQEAGKPKAPMPYRTRFHTQSCEDAIDSWEWSVSPMQRNSFVLSNLSDADELMALAQPCADSGFSGAWLAEPGGLETSALAGAIARTTSWSWGPRSSLSSVGLRGPVDNGDDRQPPRGPPAVAPQHQCGRAVHH
jgi:hypothetical protein